MKSFLVTIDNAKKGLRAEIEKMKKESGLGVFQYYAK
jgi:hypothetical protein